MRKLLASLLTVSMLLPAVGHSALLVQTGPTLREIQDGIDACKAGDKHNCKYERYAGVVRETKGGAKILPAGGNFILGDRLKPGTVLPTIKDRVSLLRKLKEKEVEIVSFNITDSPILLASLNPGEFLQQQFQQRAVVVPSHIAELARQNGIAPHEMLLHIETNLIEGARDAADIVNSHTAFVLALGANLVVLDDTQIEAKLEELESLKATIEGLEASNALSAIQLQSLQGLIDSLEDQIASLNADLLLEILVADGLRRQIESIVNSDHDAISEILASDLTTSEKTRKLAGLAANGNAVAQLAIEQALGATPGTIDSSFLEALAQARTPTVSPVTHDAADIIKLRDRFFKAPTIEGFGFNQIRRLVDDPNSGIEWGRVSGAGAFVTIDPNGPNAHLALYADQIASIYARGFSNAWQNSEMDRANNPSDYTWLDVLTYEQTVLLAQDVIIASIFNNLGELLDGVYFDGYQAGFEAGYTEGYTDGYNDGYRDGYADGFVDGVNAVSDTLNGD